MRSPSVEGLSLLRNGERPQFLQLECLRKTFALELIESILTSYHGLFRKVRVSSSSFLTSNPYIAVIFTAPGTLTPITTSPLPEDAFRTLRFPSHAPQDSRRLLLLKRFSVELATEPEVFHSADQTCRW